MYFVLPWCTWFFLMLVVDWLSQNNIDEFWIFIYSSSKSFWIHVPSQICNYSDFRFWSSKFQLVFIPEIVISASLSFRNLLVMSCLSKIVEIKKE